MKIKNNFNSGQAIIVATILFMVLSLAIIFGLLGPLTKQSKIASQLMLSRQSYFLAEAGIEDAIYRLKNGLPISATEMLEIASSTATTNISDTLDGKEIISASDVKNTVRRIKANIILGSGVSFHYGVQAGDGGIRLENTSSIQGNAFSNGPIVGSGLLNNTIGGSAVSAGPNGLVDSLYATSSVMAHNIRNAKVGIDAYYQSILNTTVLGNSYPGSADQSTSTLPITDEQVDEWKQVALDGGIISSPCPYRITDDVTIGPVKINCDLEVSGTNYTINLTGNIWVNGNITFKNSPIVRVDPSLGNKTIAIIADKPADRLLSSKIELENSVSFQGSGTPGSYVLFISQNRSAESGGAEKAIEVGNTVSGALLVYAGHGEISLENSINLKEVTAYKIRLKNTAKVIYETGLANLLFDSGPSGGYDILNWTEIE